jgi:hypothetical protein
MNNVVIFIQAHGRPDIVEAEIAVATTLGELRNVLAASGIAVDTETVIFIDDAEEPLKGEHHHPVHGLKQGSRIHVGRCRRIAVTVHFLDKIEEHPFSPGARMRAVKEWAVRKFKMDPKDAAEHVLQLCSSTGRPSSDTPLHQLLHGHDCNLCFDLVPEKRVEG